jgi:uncharacterized phage infection (PIP) family protein YhgE
MADQVRHDGLKTVPHRKNIPLCYSTTARTKIHDRANYNKDNIPRPEILNQVQDDEYYNATTDNHARANYNIDRDSYNEIPRSTLGMTERITERTQVQTKRTQVSTKKTQVQTKRTQVTTEKTQVATGITQVQTGRTQVKTGIAQVLTEITQVKTGITQVLTEITRVICLLTDFNKIGNFYPNLYAKLEDFNNMCWKMLKSNPHTHANFFTAYLTVYRTIETIRINLLKKLLL